MYKRESGSNDRNSGKSKGGKPFVKTTAAKKAGSPRGGKSSDKPASSRFGDKKPYGKTTRGEDKSFEGAPRKTRSYGEDRPSGGKGFGDRKTSAPRSNFKDDSKSFDRAPRKTRSYGEDRPSTGRGFGDRKTSAPRSNFRDKDDSKPFDRAPRKTRSYGEDKPSSERSFGDRKPSGPRTGFRDKDDSKSFDRAPRKTRSYGEDKPSSDRSFGDRKPAGPRTGFRDKDDSKSFDRAPRKTRSYGEDKPSSDRSFGDRKPAGPRTGFRDKDDSKSFDKTPRKTRSFGDEKPSSEDKKGPRSTNPYNRTPKKVASSDNAQPTKFGDRKDTREGLSRRATKSFTYNDDKPKSRSGRGPRKGEEIVDRKKAQKDETPQLGNIRLNRFISNAGVCSRREADELILAGLVTVNGVSIEEMGYQVKPNDDVRYNGERLSREKKVYILLNKPKDAITTAEDPEGRRTVMQLFGNELGERIYPVGRLDRNTTGVLLFTNDGDMAQRLMHPKYEMKKVYKATLDKTFKGEDMWQLTNGVELEDGFIKPDAVAYSDPKNKAEVGIEIHSGKNHIIHRIFESLGYKVDKLDRALYGGLTKGKLKRGEWRALTEKEVNTLKRMLKLG